MNSGRRAHRQRMGSETANRQMREEVSGMQMKMRAHGQLRTYAVKMTMEIMMIMHMSPVAFVFLPRASLPQMGRSRRMKIRMRSSTQRVNKWPRMPVWNVEYMSVRCPRRRAESESSLRIDLPTLGRRPTFVRPGRVTSDIC